MSLASLFWSFMTFKRILAGLPRVASLLCASALSVAGAQAAKTPRAPATTIPRAPAPTAFVNESNAASVALVPFADPWPSARDRWWDISNAQFNGFLNTSQTFNYNGGQVTLTYDTKPTTPYFVGYIVASGLKPNFAYQIKLVGKPVKGGRGWGAAGDDKANERLGYAGRWWCDSSHALQTNFDDAHYKTYYQDAAPGTEHDIYGYLFCGDFVTDAFGNADIDFTGKNSYHVTWAGWQGGYKHVEDNLSPYTFQGGMIQSLPTTIYYGYGSTAPTTSVQLFYEFEGSGRPRDNVRLAEGTYRCRLMLTEESFHNDKNLTPNGGYWKGVLATDPANDIVFTMPAAPTAPLAPGQLTAAAASRSQINLTWTDNSNDESGFKIERKTSLNGSWSQIATVPANTFSSTGLKSNTTYYYRVRAYNTVGNSAYSNTASAKTLR